MHVLETISPRYTTGGITTTSKPSPHPQFAQQLHVAGLAMAEVKILADEHGTHLQIAHKNLIDEVFGRQAAPVPA